MQRLWGSSQNQDSYRDTLDSFGISDLEMKARDKQDKQASSGIVPEITSQRAVTLKEWHQAIDMAKHPQIMNRRNLMMVYDNVFLDLHLDSVMETRLLNACGSPFYLYDPNGDIDKGATRLLKSKWFFLYIKEAILSRFYGYSLLEFWETGLPVAVQLNKKKVTFSPFSDVKLIDRKHVRPPLKRWYENTFDDIDRGFPYSEPPYNNYYIGLGDPDDLGKFLKIAPIALAKRYALGAWGEFDEKLGIPFRKVTMQGNNKARESKLAEILKNMGSAGWGIFQQGEEMELIQTAGTDVHKCFSELLKYCDDAMSKAVLGETMTTDSGSSRSQSETHETTRDIRFMSDQEFITMMATEYLIPLLIARGYPLEGYTFGYDQTKQLDPQKQINIDQVLLQYFDLSPEYLSNKYNIPIDAIGVKLNVTSGLLPIDPKADPKAAKK